MVVLVVRVARTIAPPPWAMASGECRRVVYMSVTTRPEHAR